jgi:glutaminyl-peptide cyclotransferase
MTRNRIALALLLLFAGAMIYVTLFRKKNNGTEIVDTPPAPAVPELKMTQVKTHSHSDKVFTEGLEFYNGKMIESAGNYGESALLQYDAVTGKAEKRVALDSMYFGEGITQLKGKIYQLTYKEAKGFIYDAATFKKTGEFKWPHGEGWGMTNDSVSIIANTGGSTIFFINPDNFSVTKTINVTRQGMPVSSVNEMEYVNGFIYANIWTTDMIIKIDAATGVVVAEKNVAGLLPGYDAATLNAKQGSDSYLNGIAYNPATKTFFITGKNWPQMFEVIFN